MMVWEMAVMGRVIEIRSYNLKTDCGGVFHALILEHSLPMLKRWNVDVVVCEPSLHTPDSYCLIRSYASLEDRQQSQDAFYGSEEWLKGPRDSILELIDSYTSVVLEVDDATLASLRRSI
jgi:hypothetical protein